MNRPSLEQFQKATTPTPEAVGRVRRRMRNTLRTPVKRRLPVRPKWFAVIAATAAMASLGSLLLRSSPIPDPRTFTAEALHGGVGQVDGDRDPANPIVFDQHSEVNWVVRPPRDVPNARRDLRAALVGRPSGGKHAVLESDLPPSAAGAYVVQQPAADYFGQRAGPWALKLIIGPRKVLTDAILPNGAAHDDRLAVFETECLYTFTDEAKKKEPPSTHVSNFE